MKTKKSNTIDPENPPLTATQLRNMRPISPARRAMFRDAYIETYGKEPPRMGRPPLGENKKVPIALRMDRDVLVRLRAKAAKIGVGYQTLINRWVGERV